MTLVDKAMGRRFRQLTVIAVAAVRDVRGRQHRVCVVRCTCGTVKHVEGYDLHAGRVVSCGCRKLRPFRLTHGETRMRKRSPEYGAWAGMITRCTNTKSSQFADYGGRGIRVCRGWRNDFAGFLRDMGRRPGPGYSVERINNSRGYTQRNCKWATRSEQAANKRNNRNLTYRGVTMNVCMWARSLRIHRSTILWRLRAGWSVAQVLSPVRKTWSRWHKTKGKGRRDR